MTEPVGFHRFYESTLKPVLERLEAQRKSAFKRLLIYVLCAIPATLILMVAILYFNGSFQTMCLAPVGAIGIFFVLRHYLTKELRAHFKREIIGGIVKFLDPKLVYSPDACVPQSVFAANGLFLDHIDRYSGEDLVSGMMGATKLQFSEVHAEHKTEKSNGKGGKNESWRTVFKGLYLVAGFNKHFHGRTVLLPDSAESMFGTLIGQKLQEWNYSRSEQLVKLEDLEFEKEFAVYATDQIEARYILSTSLMRRITDFKHKCGKTVSLSFADANVHIAIETGRDLFEPRLSGSLLDYEFARSQVADLELAIDIVDELNLNTRIWGKVGDDTPPS